MRRRNINIEFKNEALSNLRESEKKGLKSILERIEKSELCIAQTDKSGRMAVLNNQQFLQTRNEHTFKDQELSWKDIRYLQNQVNNYVWWLSEILGVSIKKDKEMTRENLIDHGLEVPQMKILIKDHKEWSYKSNKVLLSRPVFDGRGGFNTHLSELLSQILEPVALEMKGAEIESTEELFEAFEDMNRKIKTDPGWKSHDSLYTVFNGDETMVESTEICESADLNQIAHTDRERNQLIESELTTTHNPSNVSGYEIGGENKHMSQRGRKPWRRRKRDI